VDGLRIPLRFRWSYHIFLGLAWAEGKGELATCRHRAHSGWETRHSLDRLHARMNKQKKKEAYND